MILIDQNERDMILKSDNNIVISASAGSGKTTIMIKKIGIELEKIINHKTIAAITFTVKATNEIKKKGQKNIKKPFVAMTNDSFIENEIIRPFIRDALGSDFSKDYTIEYISKYSFTNYSDGVNQLKEKNILGSFSDKKYNFNFQIAYNILKKSIAAQEYIKSKYEWIFIDEYQDSDNDMNNFFMYIKNKLGIKLFIVGDSKQAIYLWRGAMSNIFELLKKENFYYYELITNFRCDKEIENYANLFHNSKYFVSTNNNVKNVILHNYNLNNSPSNIVNFTSFICEFKDMVAKNTIDLSKEITIIVNYNNDAESLSKLLNKEGFNFIFIPRTPLDEGLPNGTLLKELAKFSKNSTYTIYDFMENIDKIDKRSRTTFEINDIIEKLKDTKSLNIETISDILNRLYNYLDISLSSDEIEKFYESISNNKYDLAFKILDSKFKIMTVFASKGLEFDQVISFSRYYNIYCNRHLENHYVCITRAKEKFIMFIDDEKYYKHVESVYKNKKINDISKIANIL